jgi:hypothetical protein
MSKTFEPDPRHAGTHSLRQIIPIAAGVAVSGIEPDASRALSFLCGYRRLSRVREVRT